MESQCVFEDGDGNNNGVTGKLFLSQNLTSLSFISKDDSLMMDVLLTDIISIDKKNSLFASGLKIATLTRAFEFNKISRRDQIHDRIVLAMNEAKRNMISAASDHQPLSSSTPINMMEFYDDSEDDDHKKEKEEAALFLNDHIDPNSNNGNHLFNHALDDNNVEDPERINSFIMASHNFDSPKAVRLTNLASTFDEPKTTTIGVSAANSTKSAFNWFTTLISNKTGELAAASSIGSTSVDEISRKTSPEKSLGAATSVSSLHSSSINNTLLDDDKSSITMLGGKYTCPCYSHYRHLTLEKTYPMSLDSLFNALFRERSLGSSLYLQTHARLENEITVLDDWTSSQGNILSERTNRLSINFKAPMVPRSKTPCIERQIIIMDEDQQVVYILLFISTLV